MNLRDQLDDFDEHSLFPAEFEEAIIGIVDRFGEETSVLYDKQKLIELGGVPASNGGHWIATIFKADHGDLRDQLANVDEEILCADGFDEAIIGIVERTGHPPIALYGRELIIELLIQDDCTEEEALEHFDFNIIGSWVGEYTPAFATLLGS